MKNKPFIYVFLFSLFWAFAILGQKYAIKNGVEAVVLAPQTLLFTTIIIGLYLLVSKNTKQTKISRKSVYGSLLSGVIGGGLASFASIYGLNFTSSINAGFLVKTAAAFVVVFAYFFLKEPISKMKATFVLLLLFGAYLLATGGKAITPKIGDLFIILAAVGYALATILNRYFLKKDIHPDLVSFHRALMGFITTFILVTIIGKPVFNFKLIWVVVLISIFQSGVYVFLNKTLSVASASYMTMMSMMTPVIVAIIAIPFFGESLNPVQWFGATLIVLGGIMTQVKGLASHE